MPLDDLTSHQAVVDAAAEFDRLGRESFLRKYGYGPARQYFLRFNGRLYDSKAIVGVAYGYQYPERGPLNRRDFSGGDATVRRKLEELRFAVEIVPLGRALK